MSVRTGVSGGSDEVLKASAEIRIPWNKYIYCRDGWRRWCLDCDSVGGAFQVVATNADFAAVWMSRKIGMADWNEAITTPVKGTWKRFK